MDTRQQDAKRLMAALAAGERAALAQLITLFGPGVRAYATQVLGSAAEAEDIAQEVFLRLWRHAARYDPERAQVSTWIYRITINLCTDQRRRSRWRRFLGLESAPEPEDDSPDQEAITDARQRLSATRAAIARLPMRQRQAIVLRAAGGLETAAIAAALGTSAGAVEQLLVRARASLRQQMKEELE